LVAQWRAFVDVDERLPCHQRSLRADVHEPAHAGVGARDKRVAGAFDVAAIKLGPVAPVAELRGGMERELTALRASSHRGAVIEVATNRLSAAFCDLGGSALRPGERPNGVAVANQPVDQPTADESRPSCDKRARHRS
jgi:hypothetical protein